MLSEVFLISFYLEEIKKYFYSEFWTDNNNSNNKILSLDTSSLRAVETRSALNFRLKKLEMLLAIEQLLRFIRAL